MSAHRQVVLGALLAAALACGRTEPEASAPAATPGPAPAAAEATASSAEPSLPPVGQVQVAVGPDGILALANQAPRRRVLELIAHQTGLVVVVFVEGGDPDGLVTLRSRGEPIAVLVARALEGVPYSIEPIQPGSTRVAVVVGRREEGPAPHGDEARRETPRPTRERAERPAVPEAEALEQLASRDPMERVEGVEWVDVSSAAGFEAVVERLTNDPDPSVRAAAAESLGDADVGAVGPLLQALHDPDSDVVLAALESIEMLGDESTVSQLGPALEHPDPAVRERAAEVAEFLE